MAQHSSAGCIITEQRSTAQRSTALFSWVQQRRALHRKRHTDVCDECASLTYPPTPARPHARTYPAQAVGVGQIADPEDLEHHPPHPSPHQVSVGGERVGARDYGDADDMRVQLAGTGQGLRG